MSDKDYKGKQGADGDDYKPLKFYQDKASSQISDGFDTFSEGNEHYFSYKVDGQIVLISESYASEKGRDNGVASVEKNRLVEGRYKRSSQDSGKHYFDLVAGNHQEIATSAWFASATAMEAAIARLMGNSSEALTAADIVGGAVAAVVGYQPIFRNRAPAYQPVYRNLTSPPVAPTAPPEPVYPKVSVSAADIKAIPVAPSMSGSASGVKGYQPVFRSMTGGAEVASAVESEEKGCGCTWLWVLLPILLALLVWYLFSQCCGKPAADQAAVAPALEAPELVQPEPELSVADQAVASVQDAASGLGGFLASQLPGGVELNLPEFGVENKLIDFITDDSLPVDDTTWFEFDRIGFDTGKAELTVPSREQIANIAQIMQAYPNVKLKIGGYTDNTGSVAFNQQLSEERAESVKNSLISQGVSQERLESEGYGPQFPVASNDTEEGRAQNRRIALRVTEK